MSNYFNDLTLREQLAQLGKCRFMEASEFEDGVTALLGKKIVIVNSLRISNFKLNLSSKKINMFFIIWIFCKIWFSFYY